jgi:two-component system response regulator RegA
MNATREVLIAPPRRANRDSVVALAGRARDAESRSADRSSDSRPKLLLVDDHEAQCMVVRRVFEARGYVVRVAHSVEQACFLLDAWSPSFALVDLRMPRSSGLALIPRLKAANGQVRIVMVTGYASVATAVEAIKLGATHYLIKPVDADAVEAAFCRASGDETVPVSQRLLSADRVEWEYIQHVLAQHRGSVSAAARAMGMHRRSLQRKLSKHPPNARGRRH